MKLKKWLVVALSGFLVIGGVSCDSGSSSSGGSALVVGEETGAVFEKGIVRISGAADGKLGITLDGKIEIRKNGDLVFVQNGSTDEALEFDANVEDQFSVVAIAGENGGSIAKTYLKTGNVVPEKGVLALTEFDGDGLPAIVLTEAVSTNTAGSVFFSKTVQLKESAIEAVEESFPSVNLAGKTLALTIITDFFEPENDLYQVELEFTADSVTESNDEDDSVGRYPYSRYNGEYGDLNLSAGYYCYVLKDFDDPLDEVSGDDDLVLCIFYTSPRSGVFSVIEKNRVVSAVGTFTEK